MNDEDTYIVFVETKSKDSTHHKIECEDNHAKHASRKEDGISKAFGDKQGLKVFFLNLVDTHVHLFECS